MPFNFSFLSSNSGIGQVVERAESSAAASVSDTAEVREFTIEDFEDAKARNADRRRGIERVDVADFVDLAVSDIEQAEAKTRPEFERAAQNFINDEPELIFVAEYMVDDELVGSILVWEKYRDATHYEIFKKNLFSQDDDYQRILFLDNKSLEEERERLIPYIRETLGFTDMDEKNMFIFLDHRVKNDRIYEYKVKAARVPQVAAEIDFDLALESQDLMGKVPLSENNISNVFEFAGKTLQSEDLAWVLALLNEDIGLFGEFAATNDLVSIVSKSAAARGVQNPFQGGKFDVLIPNNMQDLLNLVSESISLFGIRETFGHIVDVIGGLSKEFRCSFIDAFDETRNVFSYDRFKRVITHQLPVFQLLLNLAESNSAQDKRALSQLSITLPTNKGSESVTSMDGLSKVFKYLNDVLIVVLYSQDNFDKIREILEEIAEGQGLEVEPLEDAADEIREEEADEADTATSVPVEDTPEAAPPAQSNAASVGSESGTPVGPTSRRRGGVVTQPGGGSSAARAAASSARESSSARSSSASRPRVLPR
jgi:hypothetical protein